MSDETDEFLTANELRRSKRMELGNLVRTLVRDEVIIVDLHYLMELVGYTNNASGGWANVRQAVKDAAESEDSIPLYGAKLSKNRVLLSTAPTEAVSRW